MRYLSTVGCVRDTPVYAVAVEDSNCKSGSNIAAEIGHFVANSHPVADAFLILCISNWFVCAL